MTAIERIHQAAKAAELQANPSIRTRSLRILSPAGHILAVDYDSTGRLMEGRRYEPGSGQCKTMPAGGLEARLLDWIEAAGTSTRTDPFEVMDSSNAAADAFTQGGASGLRQLDQGSTVTIDGPFGGDTFEIGLDGQHVAIMTRTDAEALRDHLVERFGPGPSDVR